jgi:hypothetical protein
MPTLEQVDAILKDDYKDYWENLNNATFILAQVSTKKDTVKGRIARHAIHTGRSGGIGARREGVALPTAGRQTHASVPVPVRWETGRIQLTQQLISQATGDAASFVDAMQSEMDGIRNDAARDVNRQVWGTSNGVIATCGTTTASTTLQLASTTPASAMRHLYVNRVIDIGTVASPTTIASARTITAVDLTNKTLTISGAVVTTSAIHFVFNTSSGGATDASGTPDDGQSELTGLQTIVDDADTLHTLTVASNPIWKAQVYGNSGTNRTLAETMLDYAIMQNQVESGKTIDLLCSNTGAFISAKSILSAYQRNVDTVEFKGGFRGIKWSTPGVSGIDGKEVGWYADFDAPASRIFGLNTSEGLVCHQVDEGWKWMDSDGSILSRVADQLAYEATLFTSMELACVQRNAHFVIEDITEATL